MRAKSLMVGDLVKTDQSTYTSVAMITKDGVYMNETDRLFTFDELHGIPHFGDILKHNGFHYDELEDCYEWQQGGNKTGITAEVRLVQDGKGWLCNIFGPNCETEIEEFKLRYIHELQHLMRCVGITKEIKI